MLNVSGTTLATTGRYPLKKLKDSKRGNEIFKAIKIGEYTQCTRRPLNAWFTTLTIYFRNILLDI